MPKGQLPPALSVYTSSCAGGSGQTLFIKKTCFLVVIGKMPYFGGKYGEMGHDETQLKLRTLPEGSILSFSTLLGG